MASLEIPEVVKFEVTVDEFVQVTSLILSQTKAVKVRTAMKKMIDELKHGNEQLVKEVLAPLCSIETNEEFNKEFRKIHERFKEQYLGARPVFLTINCDLITQQIRELLRSQQWKKNFGFSRAVTRLEMMGDMWIKNDAALADADYKMFAAINKFITEVAKVKSKTTRYKEYRDGIARLEQQYIAIRNQMAELEKLSAQL